jgi:hypothetical protein
MCALEVFLELTKAGFINIRVYAITPIVATVVSIVGFPSIDVATIYYTKIGRAKLPFFISLFDRVW